jgi:elongation factor G
VVWRQADRHRIPRLAFINKLDRPGADFDRVIGEMRKKLGARGVPVTAPLYRDGAYRAVADLLAMERLEFSENGQGSDVVRASLSEGEKTMVAPYREALLEAAADVDDAVAEKYLAGEEIPLPLLRGAVRKGTIVARFFPVYAGAALRNKGIQPVMDGVVHFLPSPAEVPPAKGDDPRTGVPAKRAPSPSAPFSALVFKVLNEEGRRTVYLRVYSGRAAEGDVVYNATTGGEEKIARLFRIHASKKERIGEARAGDIVGNGVSPPAPAHALLPRPHRLRIHRDPEAGGVDRRGAQDPSRHGPPEDTLDIVRRGPHRFLQEPTPDRSCCRG